MNENDKPSTEGPYKVDPRIKYIPDMLAALKDAEDCLRVVLCRIRIERLEAYERGEHTYILGSQNAGLTETWSEIQQLIAKVEGAA